MMVRKITELRNYGITKYGDGTFSNLVIKKFSNSQSGFTLIELIVSVALLLVALSIALFAVIGTNGMIQKADARSSISESTRGVGEAIRRTVANAPVGGVTPIEAYLPLDPDTTYAAIQVKAFSDLQSGNTCTIIGRASVSDDPNATGEEKYTIGKDGTLIALLIYNVDSGGLCPSLTTDPIYQNRLTNTQAIVKDIQFSLQSIACDPIVPPTCITKQLLRYSLTLEMAQKGSGGTSEARLPTLTIQEGLPIGLVNEATTVLKIETTSLPDANARGQYTANVVASGGMPPYQNWSILTGPSSYWTPSDPGGQGFSINQNTGVITSGSLNSQAAGRTYHFTVKVFDSANPSISTTRDLSITVLDNLIIITTTQAQFNSNPAQENSPYNQQLTATMKLNPSNCGSCDWSIPANSLPAGLTLDSNGRKISGTPNIGAAANSPYTLVITATEHGNPTNFDTETYQLTVSPQSGGQTLAITTLSLQNGTVGVPYSQSVTATGGIGPYTWSLFSGTLPQGLLLSPSGTPRATISGTPTTPGLFSFTVKVTDGSGTDTQPLTITIGGGINQL